MLFFNINDHRDTTFLNSFGDYRIYNNFFIKLNTIEIIENSITFNITDMYKFRPDKVAYEMYADEFYYPWILQANSLGSIFQFIPENLNYECFVPSIEYINTKIKQGELKWI